jgi:hypothetical protein
MTKVRRERLDAQWEEGYSHFKDFIEEYGHCNIPLKYKTEDSSQLGYWVGTQRTNKNKISQERRDRLDKLGFVWSA